MQFKCKYCLNIKKILFQAIQLSQIVLIQTIQFSISMQLLPFPARVDQEAVVMKECTAFLKVPAAQEPHHQIV